jgi:hypothetical protein
MNITFEDILLGMCVTHIVVGYAIFARLIYTNYMPLAITWLVVGAMIISLILARQAR